MFNAVSQILEDNISQHEIFIMDQASRDFTWLHRQISAYLILTWKNGLREQTCGALAASNNRCPGWPILARRGARRERSFGENE